MKKKCGVYKLTNIKTNDFYIGSSKDLTQRKRKHFVQIREKKHNIKKIEQHLTIHDDCDFKFEILEICYPYELEKREQYYIEKLNPTYNTNSACNHRVTIKRLNIEISIDLFKLIHKYAFKKNTTITQYVTDALINAIKRQYK